MASSGRKQWPICRSSISGKLRSPSPRSFRAHLELAISFGGRHREHRLRRRTIYFAQRSGWRRRLARDGDRRWQRWGGRRGQVGRLGDGRIGGHRSRWFVGNGRWLGHRRFCRRRRNVGERRREHRRRRWQRWILRAWRFRHRRQRRRIRKGRRRCFRGRSRFGRRRGWHRRNRRDGRFIAGRRERRFSRFLRRRERFWRYEPDGRRGRRQRRGRQRWNRRCLGRRRRGRQRWNRRCLGRRRRGRQRWSRRCLGRRWWRGRIERWRGRNERRRGRNEWRRGRNERWRSGGRRHGDRCRRVLERGQLRGLLRAKLPHRASALSRDDARLRLQLVLRAVWSHRLRARQRELDVHQVHFRYHIQFRNDMR
jgi:hypothetical protein